MPKNEKTILAIHNTYTFSNVLDNRGKTRLGGSRLQQMSPGEEALEDIQLEVERNNYNEDLERQEETSE